MADVDESLWVDDIDAENGRFRSCGALDDACNIPLATSQISSRVSFAELLETAEIDALSLLCLSHPEIRVLLSSYL